MAVHIGAVAPDFTQESPGPFIFMIGSKGLGHPVFASKGFSRGVHDRMGAVSKLKPEFGQAHIKAIGVSVDPVDSHNKWIAE